MTDIQRGRLENAIRQEIRLRTEIKKHLALGPKTGEGQVEFEVKSTMLQVEFDEAAQELEAAKKSILRPKIAEEFCSFFDLK